MKELLVATGNRGKLREFEALLHDIVARVYSFDEFPGVPVVEEDGASFAENAEKKARNAARSTGMPALADDSGLVVDALDGRPGVYSARFAGDSADDGANNARLLRELDGVPRESRRAAFHCVIAFCQPYGECRMFTGTLSGIILDTPRGDGGFGYDPLFLVPEYGRTLAELPLELKNRISHRGRALKELGDYLHAHDRS